MPQNIFKIYDGRTNFWQWDTKQKLIVLDDRITEVRFSNRDMGHSKRRPVYKDSNGDRICNVPDILLQLPKNLVAYACIKQEDGTCSTVKAVKFAVVRQPIPTDYVCEQDTKSFIKFENMVDAAKWAVENGEPGDIVSIKLNEGWVAHIVENDKSLSPICDCDGNMIIIDGDDSNGIDEEQDNFYVWDGGSAAGI